MTATPAYLLIQGPISNQAKWAEYRKAVMPVIERYGGKHLTGSGTPQLLEGSHHDWIIAMFAFASVQAIQDFWNSPEYVPVKQIREGAADLDIWIVPGSPPS